MKERDGIYSADTMEMAEDLGRLWMFRKKNFLLIELFWPSAPKPQPMRGGIARRETSRRSQGETK